MIRPTRAWRTAAVFATAALVLTACGSGNDSDSADSSPSASESAAPAKGVLQRQLELSEPDAFRWIQKTAMDLRLSMRQVAEGVVTHGPSVNGGDGSPK